MGARILDGRRIARAVRASLKQQASELHERCGRRAGLAIVRVEGDSASQVYTNALLNTSEQLGLAGRVINLARDTSDGALGATIEGLNADPAVDGILVQLPLPPHLSQRTVAEAVDPHKDVDGISLRSAGNLFLRLPSFVPSTAAAVLEMLDRSEIDVGGRRVVVVGASNVIGKPLAFLLLHRDATVTVCHIHTRSLAQWTRQADVLVVAAGKAGLISGDMVMPGAAVIDVGINVRPDGSIAGDVDFASVEPVAGALTPVPGGVGQLTNLMVVKQTLAACTAKHDLDEQDL
jgi:methylenetetrahydrofolate dehydrogenase (NADP+) / methenyltetrahydrofolate cyclohydrolase